MKTRILQIGFILMTFRKSQARAVRFNNLGELLFRRASTKITQIEERSATFGRWRGPGGYSPISRRIFSAARHRRKNPALIRSRRQNSGTDNALLDC
jgi:hypothetical protein